MMTALLSLLVAADTRSLVALALEREFGLRVVASQIELLDKSPAEMSEQQGLALRRWGLQLEMSTATYRWGRIPDLRFRLPKLRQSLRLKHAKAKGDVLRAEDVEEIATLWRPQGSSPLGFAVGYECQRALPAGHELQARDVRSVPLVRRGEPLQALQQSQNYILRFPAISMRSGGLGEVILVRKPGQAKLLPATVRGAGLVELQ